MPIEVSDVVYGNLIVEKPLPFVQAAPRRGGGVLRIQGQQNHLATLRSSQFCDGFAGKGMPVAHGNETARIKSLTDQLGLESPCLLLGEAANGRPSADGGVVVLNFTGARGRNQFGQSFATEACKREVDDVGIAEKVKKKRFYRSQRI